MYICIGHVILIKCKTYYYILFILHSLTTVIYILYFSNNMRVK